MNNITLLALTLMLYFPYISGASVVQPLRGNGERSSQSETPATDQQNEIIPLDISNVQYLKFRSIKTLNKRFDSQQQIRCRTIVCPIEIRCERKGWDINNYEWSFILGIDESNKPVENLNIICEGFDHPGDRRIIKDSCVILHNEIGLTLKMFLLVFICFIPLCVLIWKYKNVLAYIILLCVISVGLKQNTWIIDKTRII